MCVTAFLFFFLALYIYTLDIIYAATTYALSKKRREEEKKKKLFVYICGRAQFFVHERVYES